MSTNIVSLIDYAVKTKRFVSGLVRLKKNGNIVKINGQIFERKTTKSGDVIIIDNFLGNKRENSNKKWQMILVDNILELKENKWKHTKDQVENASI